MKEARVWYGSSESGSPQFNADMLWKTKFAVPDPFFVCEIEGKTIVCLSALEVERARKEACVDSVILFDPYYEQTRTNGLHPLVLFLKEHEVTDIVVPETFPHGVAHALISHFRVRVHSEALYHDRIIKTPYEVDAIERASIAVDRAFAHARNFLLESVARDDLLFHSAVEETPVCSEHIRSLIDRSLFEQGYASSGTIVASGIQAADPHCRGRGPVAAHAPIVIDVFPRCLETGYYSDETRTFFKGEPSDAYRKMYETVLYAQEGSLERIKAGVDVRDIFEWVCGVFSSRGYPTNTKESPVYGFIHSLGHGVGLEIHEHPRLGKNSHVLHEGMVVTVEPGLYYSQPLEEIPPGGVRIEDTIVVTADGYRLLTRFQKTLAACILE